MDQIIRTGYTSGNTIPLPPVTFYAGAEMANRVNTTVAVPDSVPPQTMGLPQFNQPRMRTITTETGGRINIIYNDAAAAGTNPKPCSFAYNAGPSPDSNTLPCMPVKWHLPGASSPNPVDDWFHKYLVTDVTEQDTGTGTSVLKSTHYTYGGCGGAAWHHNDSEFTDPTTRTWDDFRGYQTVTTTTGSANSGQAPQTQQTVTYLRGMDGDAWATNSQCTGQVANPLGGPSVTDSNWLAGSVLATQIYDQAGGKVLSMTGTTSSNDQKPTATHTPSPPISGVPPLIARTPAKQLTTTVMALLANNTWRTTSKVDTIDQDHGARLKQSDDKGDGTTATPEICTTISYAAGAAAPTNAVLSAVSEKQAVTGPCGTTATATSTVSDNRTLYDGKLFGQLGGFGDPSSSQALDHYDASGNPVYVLSGSVASTDAYGRTLSVSTTDGSTYDAAGNQLTGATTAVATTTTAYTPATGALPTSISTTNPLGWTSTVTQDPGRALPLTSSDPNKRVTTEHYDGLGRLIDVWQPDRATDQTASVEYSYAMGSATAPSVVTTRTLRETLSNSTAINDFSWKTELYDGLGRLVQTQTTVPQTGPGRLISDTVYDSHGWATLTRSPYYDITTLPNGTLVTPVDSQVPSETKTTYDGMGRVTQSEFLSYNQPQWGTTTAYPGADRTDVTPPQGGTPTSTMTDSRGHTTALWQYRATTVTGNATDADVTSYNYTPSGQPASRTDAAGNTWSYTYDLLGRQTSVSDPDTGVTKTFYDADSRVDHTTDAKSNTLAYSYDLLGRKTGLYTGSVAPANQQAGWTYDTLALGQLTSSTRYGKGGTTGPAYTEATTGYDTAYHPLGTSVTIPSAEGKLAGTYTTTNTYNPVLGTPLKTTLPSLPFLPAGTPAETVGYAYTLSGYLIDSSGDNTLVQGVNYDAYGRPVKTTVGTPGNAVNSVQQYDQASGHVINSWIDPQNVTSSADQYTYTYNPAGSVTSVSDNESTAATDTQCFTYDYLGRLASAWTDTGGTQTRPTGTWYDTTTTNPIGSGTSVSVPGIGGCNNASGPAGPASVGGPSPYWQNYTYDSTGNRTGLTSHNTTGAPMLDPSQVNQVSTASDGTQTWGVTVANGAVWTAPQNADGSWASFSNLMTQAGSLPAVSSVSAAVSNGQLQIMAIAGGKLWHTIRKADGTWQAWGDVFAAVGSSLPSPSQLSLTATASGLEVLTTSGGKLWHTIRHPDGTWQTIGWGDVFANVGTLASTDQIAAAATPSGLELMVGSGGKLWHTVRHPDGTWQSIGWGDVFGATGALPGIATGPNQLSLAGTTGGLEVMAIANGKPFNVLRNSSGSWSGWGDVTGAVGPLQPIYILAAAASGADLKVLTVGSGQLNYTKRDGTTQGWTPWSVMNQGTSVDTVTTSNYPAPGTVNTATKAPNTGGGTGGPHALLSTTTTSPGQSSTSTYQYDQLGNTTSVTSTSGTTNLAWNNEDQLSSASTTGQNGGTSYLYDADGNQLIRYDPGKTTVNLGADELTLYTDNSMSDVRSYGAPGGITITRVFTPQNPAGTTVYQAADPHGTNGVQIGTDAAQTVTRRLTDPFGNPRGSQPAAGTWAGDKGFVGGTQDPVTGLTNLGAREYDPVHGRFLNPDPLLDTSDPQQWNGYAYSSNDPVNSSDPTGLCPPDICGVGTPIGGTGSSPGNPTRYVETGPEDPDNPDAGEVRHGVYSPSAPNTSKGNGNGKGGNGKPKKKDFWHDPIGWSWDHKADIGSAIVESVVYSGCIGGSLGGAAETGGASLLALAGCGAAAGAAGAATYDLLSPDSPTTPGGVFADVVTGAAFGAAGSLLGRAAGVVGSAVMAKAAPMLGDAATDIASKLGRITCANSFPAATLVLLADGSTKAISTLAVGDQVASTDPQTGLTLAEPVTQTIVTPDDHAFTDLTLTTHTHTLASLTSTQHHPYWDITTHRWTNAADLHVGDQLLTTDGSTVTVQAARNYETAEQTAYNLTVADLHTYYVLAGVTPVLVHNCDPVKDFGVPNTPGVYTIHLNSGEKYVGMSTANIQDRVAASIKPGHAVTTAGYSCADICNVSWIPLPAGVKSVTARRVEQSVMEGLKSRGVSLVNRRDPEFDVSGLGGNSNWR